MAEQLGAANGGGARVSKAGFLVSRRRPVALGGRTGMSIGYYLVNASRGEAIRFTGVPASTRSEIAGTPAAAAITAWYLLTHRGEQISFLSDSDEDWPFSSGTREDLRDYPDATAGVISELLRAGILAEDPPVVFDPTEPTVAERRLRVVWHEARP